MRYEEGDKIQRFNHFYPSTVVLIGSVGKDGKLNVMPSAWHTALSRDPLLYGVSVSPKRHSHSLITETGEFTLNFVGAKMAETIRKTGGVSGREVDKLKAFDIAYSPGKAVRAPVIAGAYCTYECRLAGMWPAGDHDLVIGEVLGVHTDEDAFRDDGVLDLLRTEIDLYMGAYTYATLDRSTRTIVRK
ncbi:MAG: flavin reductase family protein [Bacillota bacterium]|jgi:flavin reductase (DIM6/NTAB) family NADH-FMN oxidoreductase RutF